MKSLQGDGAKSDSLLEMNKQFPALLPLIALLGVIAILRLGVGSVVNEASRQPAVFPTAAPFASPLCGQDNRNCSWQGFESNWQTPQPFKGLTRP